MEFPRLVYKSAALHLLTKDEKEFDAAIADGWFATVPEALEPAKPVVSHETVDNSPPTREELETKATELGIPFKGTWGDKKIAEAIAEKLKA